MDMTSHEKFRQSESLIIIFGGIVQFQITVSIFHAAGSVIFLGWWASGVKAISFLPPSGIATVDPPPPPLHTSHKYLETTREAYFSPAQRKLPRCLVRGRKN